MLTSQRKQHILAVLKRDGQIVAKSLSQELGLSEDTIRRDLRDLAAEGLLQRVHGGALPASPAVATFEERTRIAPEGKIAIGQTAAKMIRPGQVVILDGGTTAVQVARHLPRDLQATIVTHSPTIAVELAAHPTVEVIVIGGRLFKHSIVAVGAAAIEAMSHVRADLFFMGVTGVHPEAGLSTGDLEDALVKRALSKRAAETVVLASSEKIGVASAYVIAPVAEASTLIVERDADREVIAELERSGLSLVRA
ncbi:DeoR/GlpR family DNA-binding transcription regulator [Deinococcus yavapaiensis]|uniref:DeoR family transcriptional regulator n=1 Tax=Deinococcus yavapaiensis KR-236 TaxID=694435 RepID=A0A318SHP3_9DEIO|nr:DeoR/GlpR family DNA-binding transcription regulator [Deinococcus yavapaiensis]PYE50542.1 DeoR family transcriptional regulator [Deinococcus yavapaiensis KR-236]